MEIVFGKINNPYTEDDLKEAYEKGYRDGERNALHSILKGLKSDVPGEKSNETSKESMIQPVRAKRRF